MLRRSGVTGEAEKLLTVNPRSCTFSSSQAVLAVNPRGDGCIKSSASCIEESARRRFEPWELGLIKCEALQEYNLLKNASERREMEREESIAREELIAGATSFLAALLEWQLEARGKVESDRPLSLLLERLQKRETNHQHQYQIYEEALREEGRVGWRQEVEKKTRLREYEAAMAQWRRECEETLRAAVAFLLGMQTRERQAEAAEEEAAWAALCAQELTDRAEAERLAYENFMKTPEQVALRKERERLEAAANRAAARRLKQFLKEQEHLVKSCTHARGHVSFFEGALAKKLCVSCGVKFDETLGYYVRMRGRTIAPPSTWTPPQPPPAPERPARHSVTKLPPLPPPAKQGGRRTLQG
ncbi:hypothetical protein TraAM80_07578 [Trypanosoma rangeli]|uniref:Uncharacterized protein n=1 Tax=Trypanosoma rangeli TaxID=5698 RepID=A0A422N4R6_TRYRA|nr:uncharacterized protein TraAM80_07578 [Trypanosoma rangeli]RNF00469.1 hypothetical protein TraAM80_07578 [Trypanosoma rangeli]|eukprot:RNF00469.1 hypothetical protein TraAM80_07578 [Trypanosoma rangeli]